MTTMTYVAEIQDRDGTREHRGTAADVAAWLDGWRGRDGRSVAVYRVDSVGGWHMVDLRSTRERGTAPAGYAGDWRRDAVWDAAVLAASEPAAVERTWSETIDRAMHFPS
jgi:hypothetical protein